MADRQTLNRDLHDLLSRITPDGLVRVRANGKPSVQASLLALPTLAERGRIDELQRVAAAVLDRRDETGGWDDPWTTVIGVEAFVALTLRGITINGAESVLEFAVNVIRGSRALEPMEREMRLARAIILAGMARQDASLIDAGILRIHGLLEHGADWSADLSEQLHALLTLADLHTITKDDPTRELLDQRLEASGLTSLATDPTEHDSETLARAGVVLVKLGHEQEALAVYQRVAVDNPASLSSSALKHRIELGARLEAHLPDGTADEPSKVANPEETDTTTESTLDSRPKASIVSGSRRVPLTAIVVQDGDAGDVTRTVDALLDQDDPPAEIVVGWTSPERTLMATPATTAIRQLHDAPGTSAAALAHQALQFARGDWVLFVEPGTALPAGLTTELQRAIGTVADDIQVIHAASRANETVTCLERVMVEPVIAPHRVAMRRASVVTHELPEGVRHHLPWALQAELSSPEGWWEVVVPAAADESRDDLRCNLHAIEDAPSVWRALSAGDDTVESRRAEWLDEQRSHLYKRAQDEQRPLVSVILDLRGSKLGVERSLKTALHHTDGLPFELIGIIEEHSDLDQALEGLGILSVKLPEHVAVDKGFDRAVQQARGEMLAFVDGPFQLGDQWLTTLFHAMQDHGLGLVGALVAGGHGGVCLAEDGSVHGLDRDSLERGEAPDALSGGAVLLRGSLYKGLGGFADLPDPWRWIDFSFRALGRGERLFVHTGVTVSGTGAPQPVSEMPDLFRRRWSGRMGAGQVRVSVASSTVRGKAMKPAKPESTEGGIRRLLADAEELIRQKRYDDVDSTLSPAEDQLNGNLGDRVLFWTLLGDARFRLDRPEDAYTCYQKAVQDDPSAVRAWIGIGTYHMIRDEFDAAGDIFHKVISLSPNNLRGHLGLGNTLLRAQHPDEAIPWFQKALRLDPGYRHAVVGLVAASVQAEKMGEAEEGLGSYLLQHPEDVEARFHLAAILFGTSRLDRAREEAEEVLRMKPDHVGAKEILQHVAGQPSS